MAKIGNMIRKKHDTILSHGFLLIFILFGLGFPQVLQAVEEKAAELIEGAKKEGKLSFYTIISAGEVEPLVKSFEAKYPFIKVEYIRSGSEAMLTRILNEAKAKRYVPDVINTGASVVQVLKKAGMYAKYVSPERKAFADYFKDSEGYYTDMFYTTKPIVYNTKLVPRDQAPKSYEDLLEPQYQGFKMALEGSGSGIEWFISMMNKMGEKKGEEYMRRFVKQRPVLRNGNSLIHLLVAAGECPIGAIGSGRGAEALIERGAPIEWVRMDSMFTSNKSISLSAHAPHPNSGKLFIDFVLSRAGQEIIKKSHNIPTRSEIGANPPRLLEGIKLFPFKAEWAEDYDKYAKKYAEIFRK